MNTIKPALLGASLLALLTGCGGGETSNTASEPTANAQASANMTEAAMPTGPFAQVEMQMHERMMAATGANASETWARKMIEHHRGAVQMSQLLIDQGGDPQMVQMARQTIDKQQREIGELERLVAGGISGGTGEANPYGPVEQQMHRQMMSANGGNLSETWARKMIAHHQGAIDMSELLIRQGGDPEMVAMARRTADDQRREIAHLEAMLRGEEMPAPATPAPVTTPTAPERAKAGNTAAPAPRERAPASKAASSQKPAQRSEATPPPSTSGPTSAPKATCTPEHRAMGHC
jgi:uncharacterized protein (DUF305 family)